MTPGSVETDWPSGVDGQRSITTEIAKGVTDVRVESDFTARAGLLTAAGAGRSFHPNPCISRGPPARNGGCVKTMLKRLLIWMYCRDLLSMTTVARMFERFNLKGL